jgi:hypothetical protein
VIFFFIPITVMTVYFLYRWYQRKYAIITDSTITLDTTIDMNTDTDYRGNIMLALGLQNNNPGNLRPGDTWHGIDPDQPSYDGFIRFSALKYGIRAAIINLSNEIKAYGSIENYIAHYAPPSENNTEAYIASVCSYTGLSRTTVPKLDGPTLVKLAQAHFLVENGASANDHISADDMAAGLALTPYA